MRPENLPSDTVAALGNHKVESRSLLVDRFAEPGRREHSKSFPEKVVKQTLAKHEQDIRLGRLEALSALTKGRKNALMLHAKLQARLLLNMAGGVMENAGLCLDRLGGFPIIPGSAVKGCARRMAIQSIVGLREEKKSDEEIVKALVKVCLVFGWGATEWKDGRNKNKKGEDTSLRTDLEYACGEGESWRRIRRLAANLLLDCLPDIRRRDEKRPWTDLPNFAGSVSFLPAVPSELPLQDLELEVLTCHHPDYYGRKKDRQGNEVMPVAHDTENPNLVYFPAVAPGAVFQFTLLPLRGCPAERLAHAKDWLASGLEVFGLGAKTAAGYGWFDASVEFQREWAEKRQAEAQKRAEEARRQRAMEERRAAEEKAKTEEEEKRRRAKELEEKLKTMTPEQQAEYKLLNPPDRLRNQALLFDKLKDEAEKAAIVRLLRGEHREVWDDIKGNTKKTAAMQAIRAESNRLKLGKMP